MKRLQNRLNQKRFIDYKKAQAAEFVKFLAKPDEPEQLPGMMPPRADSIPKPPPEPRQGRSKINPFLEAVSQRLDEQKLTSPTPSHGRRRSRSRDVPPLPSAPPPPFPESDLNDRSPKRL